MRHRSPSLFRLCIDLFRNVPPLSRSLYVPGAVVLAGYPVLVVLLGPARDGHAFATAFIMGFALRTAMGFEGMLRRLLARYAVIQGSALALVLAMGPLAVLMLADDPLWCQRAQSMIHLGVGLVFLADVLKRQVTTAASLWPGREMASHLPTLTRMMVIYSLGFLLLNETLVAVLASSNWLLFWAVLPVIGHMVLRAMVLGAINMDGGQPV